MRKYYLDNIRWITVVTVVIYHVLYMYNAEGIIGGVGKITNLDIQYYDMFQYLVYPWFMPILFLVAGISSQIYLANHTDREFVKSRTRKLLVPFCLPVYSGVYKYFIGNSVSGSAGHGCSQTGNLPYHGSIGQRSSVVYTSALALQYDTCVDKEDRKGKNS